MQSYFKCHDCSYACHTCTIHDYIELALQGNAARDHCIFSSHLCLSGELSQLFLFVRGLCGAAQGLSVHPCFKSCQGGISDLNRSNTKNNKRRGTKMQHFVFDKDQILDVLKFEESRGREVPRYFQQLCVFSNNLGYFECGYGEY